MESIEEIAERIAKQTSHAISSFGPVLAKQAEVEAFTYALTADPAFRRLMAEELVKVDMEPEINMHCNGFRVVGYTKEQHTAAVLKEREECAKVCINEQVELIGPGDEAYNTAIKHCVDSIRSRTERTE